MVALFFIVSPLLILPMTGRHESCEIFVVWMLVRNKEAPWLLMSAGVLGPIVKGEMGKKRKKNREIVQGF